MTNPADFLALEALEIVPPNFTLAYVSLARRVAAIDAILASHGDPINRIIRSQEEVSDAMKIIQQLETPVMIVDSLPTEQGGFDT
jgi:hypothetical protein